MADFSLNFVKLILKKFIKQKLTRLEKTNSFLLREISSKNSDKKKIIEPANRLRIKLDSGVV